MGRILFIRVSAETYDEKDVLSAWPLVCASVWPDPAGQSGDSPASIARKIVPASSRGVLQLVDAFADYAQYSDMPDEQRDAVKPVSEKLAALRQDLDDALGDRDVHKAWDLTNAIEDALDEAEKALSGLRKKK